MSERRQRRFAAIVAAEVFGSWRLVTLDEEGAIRTVKGCMNALELVIGLHRERVFKTTDDGMLVAFGSVVDTVSAAIAMQVRVADRNRDLPEADRITFRIGIEVGEVVTDGDSILGDSVNITARIEAEAQPGGVVVSARVHDDVAGTLNFDFSDVGTRQIKSVARAVRLYELRQNVDHSPVRPAVPALPDKPSIARLLLLAIPAEARDPPPGLVLVASLDSWRHL